MQINTLNLDILPTNILFAIQCTDAAGAKTSPTVDALIVYEKDGTDLLEIVAADEIGNSPFDPVQIPTDAGKTGLWSIMIAKSNFTAGRYYVFLWEVTVDGVTTAKIEVYFMQNASQMMADVSALATEANATVNAAAVIAEVDANEVKIDAVKVDTAAILVDTGEMQPKLPANFIMGSADPTNKSDDIDNILVDTTEIQSKLPASDIAGEAEATVNRDIVIGHVNANEVKIDTAISDIAILNAMVRYVNGEAVYNIAAVAVPARNVLVGMLDTVDISISATQVLHVELTYNANQNVVSKAFTVV